jgi:pterin-4a-carbinolamine dehydratase
VGIGHSYRFFSNFTLYKDDTKQHHSDFWNLSEITLKKKTTFKNYLNTWDVTPSNFIKVTSVHNMSC